MSFFDRYHQNKWNGLLTNPPIYTVSFVFDQMMNLLHGPLVRLARMQAKAPEEVG